jgi:hypothetical protein
MGDFSNTNRWRRPSLKTFIPVTASTFILSFEIASVLASIFPGEFHFGLNAVENDR